MKRFLFILMVVLCLSGCGSIEEQKKFSDEPLYLETKADGTIHVYSNNCIIYYKFGDEERKVKYRYPLDENSADEYGYDTESMEASDTIVSNGVTYKRQN